MVKNEMLEKFAEQMEEILEEKSKQYQDFWRTCNLGTLAGKLKAQVRKLVFFKNYKSRAKRTLIHIANYCYFIYNRLD